MVGRSEFYPALLALMGKQVRHDLLALARYSRCAPPDLLAPADFDAAAIRRYYDGLYLFDPFYRLWQDRGIPGVVTLQDVAPADLWGSPYATEFLHDVRISDEVCVFLPPLGGASVTLIMDRATGRFSRGERERIRELYPVLARLHELHVRNVLSSGLNAHFAPDSQPHRLIDHSGAELYATPSWPPDGAGASAARRQIRLEADFVLAPRGTIEYLDAAQVVAPGLDARLSRRLTPRERDVVELTLAGYPTISIAKRLGLAVGTVKNHRTRIFRKLDITTERELFLHRSPDNLFN
jgi:DNA-binding CsgD family transcriptional regulator